MGPGSPGSTGGAGVVSQWVLLPKVSSAPPEGFGFFLSAFAARDSPQSQVPTASSGKPDNWLVPVPVISYLVTPVAAPQWAGDAGEPLTPQPKSSRDPPPGIRAAPLPARDEDGEDETRRRCGRASCGMGTAAGTGSQGCPRGAGQGTKRGWGGRQDRAMTNLITPGITAVRRRRAGTHRSC